MPKDERKLLIGMLDRMDSKANYAKILEKELMDAYDTTSIDLIVAQFLLVSQ